MRSGFKQAAVQRKEAEQMADQRLLGEAVTEHQRLLGEAVCEHQRLLGEAVCKHQRLLVQGGVANFT